MKDFLTNLNSLSWWLSVVIVGIIINLSSSYLKNRLDATLSSISSRWRSRSETKKAKRQKELAYLHGNSQGQIMMSFSELRDRLRAIQFFVFGILLFGIVAIWGEFSFNYFHGTWADKFLKITVMAIGTISIFIGMQKFGSALYKKHLLMDICSEEEVIDIV